MCPAAASGTCSGRIKENGPREATGLTPISVLYYLRADTSAVAGRPVKSRLKSQNLALGVEPAVIPIRQICETVFERAPAASHECRSQRIAQGGRLVQRCTDADGVRDPRVTETLGVLPNV
jgi:hypothetical protein